MNKTVDRKVEQASDLLGDISAKYYDQLDGSEKEALHKARIVLENILEDQEA